MLQKQGETSWLAAEAGSRLAMYQWGLAPVAPSLIAAVQILNPTAQHGSIYISILISFLNSIYTETFLYTIFGTNNLSHSDQIDPL